MTLEVPLHPFEGSVEDMTLMDPVTWRRTLSGNKMAGGQRWVQNDCGQYILQLKPNDVLQRATISAKMWGALDADVRALWFEAWKGLVRAKSV